MKKKLIIMMIIIILIIILLLGLLIFLEKNNEEVISEETEQEVESVQNTVKPISSNIQLFTVQSYIQKFIEQININNPVYYTGGERIDESIISKWIYSLLSKEYIDKNSITEENVYEYVDNIEESLIFVPLKMNMIEIENTTKYAIYGFTQTQANEYKEDVYFILNVDNKNNTYSIEPINDVKTIDEIELTENDLVIEPNRYNAYKENEVTDEYICEQYLFMYKRMMLAKTQEAYNYLNEEYRDKKFGSLQNYTYYVTDNKDKIAQTVLNAYSINDNKYICKDQWENYYIFNINGVLDYNVMLDTYTVDLLEFTEKYNNATEQEKVAANINKIMTAINNDDYKYVYSKLADSFKNNYFHNEDELKNYLEEKLFTKNEANYETFTKEGTNLYTYKINISDSSSNSDIPQNEGEAIRGGQLDRIYMNIVMQLNEGTDFVMSFSIEE